MKIYWENKAMEDLMSSNKISTMEQDLIIKKHDEVKANFLQEFGCEGKFRVEQRRTSGTSRIKGKLHAGRTSWRIRADDARTTAALKRQPGWLGRFMK